MAHIVSVSRDPLLLRTRCAILEGLGFIVSSFERPEDAAEFMRNSRDFDLLLLGHTLTRTESGKLAQVAKSSAPTVVIIALYCNFVESKHCPPCSIPVPFADPEGLVDAVKKALENRSAGSSSGSH